MDWDGIKYIFQIPISWYRKIHNMVFHAYGTNFLTVREGYYGGMEVGIDSDGFAAEVNRAVDLSGYVKTVDGQKPDLNGNVQLSGIVKTIDEQEPDENGNVDLSGYVKTIDGEEPDLSGNIDLSDYYVTLDTDQTISGYKVFENVVTMSNGLSAYDADIYVDESNKLNIDQDTALAVNTPLVQLNDTTTSAGIDIYPEIGGIEIYTYQGRGGGGYIDFHTDGANNDYDSRIIDLSDGFSIRAMDKPLYLYSYYQNTNNPTGIVISAAGGQYQQLLTNEPARLYSTGADNQIASRGYVRVNFSRSTHTHGNISNSGQITADSGATPTNYYIAADSNGNLFRKDASGLAPSLSGYVTKDELTDYVQQDELTNYVTQSEITDFVTQSELTDFVTQSELTDYVTQSEITDFVTQADLTDYVTQNDLTDFVTQSELTDYATQQDIDDVLDAVEDELTAYVQSVDGHSPDSNGAVSFGLTGSKWVKTDSSGHLTTTNESVASFASSPTNNRIVITSGTSGGLTTLNASGTTATVTVVTSVTWNGTQLVIKSRNLTYNHGILTSTGTESTSNINTVAYTS